MVEISTLVRPNILSLKPYSSARDDFQGQAHVWLDANENPFGSYNRYPDPYQSALKRRLAELNDLPSENIFIGNGSDEVIDLVFRVFCQPGVDNVLQLTPTYGMYKVSADINGVEMIDVPLNGVFDIDLDALEPKLADRQLKVIFLCSTNNPTGNVMDREALIRILERFNGIVFLDEAYAEFAQGQSCVDLVNTYNNLVVSRTFSKARGLAAARVGIAYAGSEIIRFLNKVKPPYNVSALNQQAAVDALNDSTFNVRIGEILDQRDALRSALDALPFIRTVFPSQANFLLVEVEDADRLYEYLVNKKIIIRNRNNQVPNTVRITVGTADENKRLLNALKHYR